jgi:hypothetical protein
LIKNKEKQRERERGRKRGREHSARRRGGGGYFFFWNLPPPLRDCLTEEGGGGAGGARLGVEGAKNEELEFREVGVVRESWWYGVGGAIGIMRAEGRGIVLFDASAGWLVEGEGVR